MDQILRQSAKTWLTNVMQRKLEINFPRSPKAGGRRRLLLLRFPPRVTAGRAKALGREKLGTQTRGGARHRPPGGNQVNGDVLPRFGFRSG